MINGILVLIDVVILITFGYYIPKRKDRDGW